MPQFSSNGQDVQVDLITGELVFIDPLYLGKIGEKPEQLSTLNNINSKLFIKRLEEAFFPYGGGTLIGYKNVKGENTYNFSLSSMSFFDDDDDELEAKAVEKEITTIGIDSASFLIFDIAYFEKMAFLIRYDDLDETLIHNINQQVGKNACAYVESPGMDMGFVFDGDGGYLIG